MSYSFIRLMLHIQVLLEPRASRTCSVLLRYRNPSLCTGTSAAAHHCAVGVVFATLWTFGSRRVDENHKPAKPVSTMGFAPPRRSRCTSDDNGMFSMTSVGSGEQGYQMGHADIINPHKDAA